MWIAAVGLAAHAVQVQGSVHRALLIGINDYSASNVPATSRQAARYVGNLDGAVNDIELMRELLPALYGFQPSDIVTLTNQQATRAEIFSALQRHLVEPARKGDIIVFYFTGHGSQVRNSRSREADRLDESILPADSHRGAPDIRDKELRAIFNHILDRGAQLTIILDTCHSGSGGRGPGLPGGFHYRGVEPDLRDVADPSEGPDPEKRGALILAAAHDFDLAFETQDEQKNIRGAFSWALARAMRDSQPLEPARETFLRAQAFLHAERPAQNPVLSGTTEARTAPLFGWRTKDHDRGGRDRGTAIAVVKATGENQYLLDGGWASGITVGSELRLQRHPEVRFEVTSLSGVAHSTARRTKGAILTKAGDLLEIVAWAAPPSPPLRLWIPSAGFDIPSAAVKLHDEAVRRGIAWVDDPTEMTVKHLLRWRGAWELIADGRSFPPDASPLAKVPPHASIFVQLPAPPEFVDLLSSVKGIELTPGPEGADYIVAGRLAGDRVEYACILPDAGPSDAKRSVLPLRTAWIDGSRAFLLRDCLVRLRIVQGWQGLRSPSTTASPYRLAIRRAADGVPVDGPLVSGTRYKLLLREKEHISDPVYARYVYAFVVASDGSGILLFPPPDGGNVENLLPVTPTPGEPLSDPPVEIPLNATRDLVVSEPYGVDTYFLLSTGEPLPSLAGLEWKGVRAPRLPRPQSALEELLLATMSGTRSATEPILTPPTWTIDKVVFESVPRRRSAR